MTWREATEDAPTEIQQLCKRAKYVALSKKLPLILIYVPNNIFVYRTLNWERIYAKETEEVDNVFCWKFSDGGFYQLSAVGELCIIDLETSYERKVSLNLGAVPEMPLLVLEVTKIGNTEILILANCSAIYFVTESFFCFKKEELPSSFCFKKVTLVPDNTVLAEVSKGTVLEKHSYNLNNLSIDLPNIVELDEKNRRILFLCNEFSQSFTKLGQLWRRLLLTSEVCFRPLISETKVEGNKYGYFREAFMIAVSAGFGCFVIEQWFEENNVEKSFATYAKGVERIFKDIDELVFNSLRRILDELINIVSDIQESSSFILNHVKVSTRLKQWSVLLKLAATRFYHFQFEIIQAKTEYLALLNFLNHLLRDKKEMELIEKGDEEEYSKMEEEFSRVPLVDIDYTSLKSIFRSEVDSETQNKWIFHSSLCKTLYTKPTLPVDEVDFAKIDTISSALRGVHCLQYISHAQDLWNAEIREYEKRNSTIFNRNNQN
eukprot:augustus_masked-scaffold_5-processed-gene-20.29-mRNA-1 protein AED:1.00 eAED:1.00 QI:0/-1/0/0/-1/1/1/0/489